MDKKERKEWKQGGGVMYTRLSVCSYYIIIKRAHRRSLPYNPLTIGGPDRFCCWRKERVCKELSRSCGSFV